MLICVSGCGKITQTSNPPVIIDTACKWVEVIRLHGNDADVMDIRTLRTIDSFNRAVEKNCPKENK